MIRSILEIDLMDATQIISQLKSELALVANRGKLPNDVLVKMIKQLIELSECRNWQSEYMASPRMELQTIALPTPKPTLDSEDFWHDS